MNKPVKPAEAKGFPLPSSMQVLPGTWAWVEQNLAESYKWFALAAAQGDQDAAKKRDDVAGRLDAQSLVAARLHSQLSLRRKS